MENESSELVVNSYGSFIGITNRGISLKVNGKKKCVIPSANLHHITILCDGVSISSNAIKYCMENGIGIDFFSRKGQHYASILTDRYIHTSLWKNQESMSLQSKNELPEKSYGENLKTNLISLNISINIIKIHPLL